MNQQINPPERMAHLSIDVFCLCRLRTLTASASTSEVRGQTIVERWSPALHGSRATPDLILIPISSGMALEPSRPFNERPASADLNHALRLLQDQLLILQEARKLPAADTEQARQEIDDAVEKIRNELAQEFGSAARLQERMARVGLSSDQLNAMLRDRVTIEKYLDFRFRAFVIFLRRDTTVQ